MDDVKATLWTLGGTLIGFKIATSVLILYYFPSWQAFGIIFALSLIWFVPLMLFLPGYARERYRLWNARFKRQMLVDQEWNTDFD